MVRRAVERGVDARDALTMATLNAASWHGLRDRGAVAAGHRADLLVLPDLSEFLPQLVLKDGRVPQPPQATPVPDWATNTVRIQPLSSGRPADAFGPARRCA